MPKTNATNTGVTAPPTEIDYEAEAAQVLERIRIMRVFDFVGLVEAVGEIRAELEKPASREKEVNVEREVGGEEWLASPPRRSAVPDSQADEDEEEEMLFQASQPKAPDGKPFAQKPAEPNIIAQEENSKDESSAEKPKTSLILLDSLHTVVNPLMKSDYTQAHALLVPFLRSLTNLTHTHTLVTILLNTAITPTPGTTGAGSSTNPAGPNPTPSIFSSCSLRPSLGTTFPYYLDLHLLVHRVPKDGKKKGDVHVVEVLSDRWEGRVGRWAGFNISREGIIAEVGGSGSAAGRLRMGIEVPEFSTWWRHK